jgi:hypothetical protein
VPTPVAGIAVAAASPRAVAIPIRSPVNEPGPSPAAIRSTPCQPPTAAAARSTSASSEVAWRGRPVAERPSWDSCRTSPPRQAQAAVSTVAVSKPTTTRRLSSSGARQRLTRKMKVPTFFPLTNQVTRCLPGIVEVILFT